MVIADGGDFNCTIQELKYPTPDPYDPDAPDFNCTIQELKLFKDAGQVDVEIKFQLHHTGIKIKESRRVGSWVANFN